MHRQRSQSSVRIKTNNGLLVVQVTVEGPSSSVLLASRSVAVHMGCPGGLTLFFDAEATVRAVNDYWSVQCDKGDSDVPCFDFGAKFIPVFKIRDDVLETSLPYTEPYSLNIIGIGTTRNSIQSLENNKIQKFIWTEVNQTGNATVKSKGITWVCGPKSPCGELKPVSLFKPAKLFVLLKFSNGLTEDDYCHFSLTFVIQLRNVPLGSITITVILIVRYQIFFGI
eukprot:m.132340 g.132340  ORF g.132340 m.132340 type:complete len:225 (+) comp38078_c1_seq11:8651-9325(+)